MPESTMSEHAENTPADGVNPQAIPVATETESLTNLQTQEGTGGAATTNADTQERGEPTAETAGEKTEARPEGRAKDRIQQLVAEKKQLLWERDAALRELDTLKPKPAGTDADYADETAHRKAIAEEVLTEGERRAAQRAAQRAHERAAAVTAQAYSERVNDFMTRAPDYVQVTQNPNLTVTALMRDAILDSAYGPEVAYFLGKNPDQAARIASMTEVRQAAEIGRLEERLSAPVQKRTTQAPPPPKTIQGTTAASTPNPEEMSHEEYRKMRMGGKG